MQWRRLFATVRFLKPVQLYGRLWFRLYRPAPDLRPAPQRRMLPGEWVAPLKKADTCVSRWCFKFLNQQHECDFPAAWQRDEWGRLWLYNLHYCDCLSAEGMTKRDAADLIALWISGNPPGDGVGWQPYPLSLRIVNWIKWILAGNELNREMADSLAAQVRYLKKRLEFHLLGNHLFANGKALVFAGLFFSGCEADDWLRTGMKILAKEVPEQILADGGHFERSPMYHAIIFEDLLDLINLYRASGRSVPAIWEKKAAAMARWLAIMTHPDGDIALFNDAALGIAARPESLHAYFDRLFGWCIDEKRLNGCESLPQSGYFVMIPSSSDRLLVDCGEIGPDYQPGHSHCDMLSFELSLSGKRVVVDSGCGIYVDGEMRRYNRGNAGHNTITIDGINQSEVWGAHRCGRRAWPECAWLVEDDGLLFQGRHNGYCHLPGAPVHQRKIHWFNQVILIDDLLEGSGLHCIHARLHLHPELVLNCSDDRVTVGLGENDCLVITPLADGGLKVEDGFYCPEFGKFLPCKVLVWEKELELPCRCGWRLRLEKRCENGNFLPGPRTSGT